MKLEKIDFFQPFIIVVAILLFLVMGYFGSFNYRFEDPLDLNVILTVIFSCIIFTAGIIVVKYKITVDKTRDFEILSEKLLIVLIAFALILQSLNMVLLGGIPLFNSVLKANADISMSFSDNKSMVISKDLKKRGMKFVGPTIIYSYLESIGIINNHIHECFRYEELK